MQHCFHLQKAKGLPRESHFTSQNFFWETLGLQPLASAPSTTVWIFAEQFPSKKRISVKKADTSMRFCVKKVEPECCLNVKSKHVCLFEKNNTPWHTDFVNTYEQQHYLICLFVRTRQRYNFVLTGKFSPSDLTRLWNCSQRSLCCFQLSHLGIFSEMQKFFQCILKIPRFHQINKRIYSALQKDHLNHKMPIITVKIHWIPKIKQQQPHLVLNIASNKHRSNNAKSDCSISAGFSVGVSVTGLSKMRSS